MLILLVTTYWVFMTVSMVALSKLLWGVDNHLAMFVIGFFLLAKVTKGIAEVNLTKIVAAKQAELLKEWTEKQKVPDSVFPPQDVKRDVL